MDINLGDRRETAGETITDIVVWTSSAIRRTYRVSAGRLRIACTVIGITFVDVVAFGVAVTSIALGTRTADTCSFLVCTFR